MMSLSCWEMNGWTGKAVGAVKVEAWTGIEPVFTDLQSAA